MEKSVINWGYNCLTIGVHHGRPEKLWNLPILYAVMIYSAETLEEIVVARIYNDAMQLVTDGREPRPSMEWAIKTRELAREKCNSVLNSKLDELGKYYRTNSFKNDSRLVVEQIKKDKLNKGYEPLHHHDSINMLCRILGVSCSIEASNS